jgi:hypothetical protein
MTHPQSPRRRIARAVPALWLAALIAVCCAGTALAASSSGSGAAKKANLSGKWKGQYSGAYSGKFTIHWTQTGRKLKGTLTLSNPKSKNTISGSVRGKKIKFGTVDSSNAITYHGSWSKGTMSGSYDAGGRSGSWSAHKAS